MALFSLLLLMQWQLCTLQRCQCGWEHKWRWRLRAKGLLLLRLLLWTGCLIITLGGPA